LNKLHFESFLEFLRGSNIFGKSDKFSEIPSSHDLCQNEFSCVHLYVRFRVTKQVPNGLVQIKETSLNMKFNPYNIQYTNQTCKDVTQASEILSELLSSTVACATEVL
jgi:alkyl hydroperoxide reductase subunit AhpF